MWFAPAYAAFASALEYDAEGTLCSDSGRFAMCYRCRACCGALMMLAAAS